MIQWKAIAAFVLLALVVGAGLGCYAGYHMGSLSANAKLAVMKADDAKALAKAESDARANEQLAADTLNHIQAQNEQDKADAQAQYEKDVADLRSGALRLRKQWSCPATSVPGTPASSGESDAAAEQRNKDAADLVRNAADADAQIRALQDIVKADRQ